MYEELIRVLRHCGNPNVSCKGCYDEDDCIGTDGAWEIGAMANMRSAADAIEALSKSRWISVTERLPNVDETKDKYENVIVIAYSRGWKISRPMIYERACVRGKTVYRWKYIWDRIYDGIPVTHWMPLPDAPKEEV